ncbi:lysylphosphatidylglycerol synthase transmembrane domain-containing protein [Amycolatopsis anabasis]|uniref:lysylphosphatidylglycerol synthase transmembrane domain-containing protein n=1 Tax=Amycolatopsis anabasis TaxID=1840409 RepID=UPI00131BCB4A|nr:lysylphosphatidylglycerol synthase transmembrane domain-containing protein [Amycolatopsis anabasis]
MTTVEPEATAEELAKPVSAPKSTKAKLIDVARWVAIIVVLGLAGWKLASNWDEFWLKVKDIPWQSSVLSQFALVASIAAGVYAWQVIVDDLGKPIGYARGAQINLVGALAKYLPGSVWQYLLQMELGKKVGLARARIFTSSLIQLGVGIVAALVLSLFAMPAVFANSPNAWWLLVLLPLGFTALHPKILTWGTSLVLRILRRPPLDHPLTYRTIGKVFGGCTAAWALQGLHLWLLANSIGAPGFSGLIMCIGAMAISMTAGNFAFILPGGVGVREAVIVAVLTASGIDTVAALACAVVSRVMFIVADLITAGGAAVAAYIRR